MPVTASKPRKKSAPRRAARKRRADKPCCMEPQTVQLGGESYVIVAEGDYFRLRIQAGELTQEDVDDIRESRRRLADPTEKPIPWEQVKQEAGLA